MRSSDPISSIVDTHIVSVEVTAKAQTALKLLNESNLIVLPVVDDGRLVGIVRAEKLKNADLVSSVMEKPLFLERERSIDYAIKYLLKHGMGRVPAVDSSIGMQCIGTISSTALLNAKKSGKK